MTTQQPLGMPPARPDFGGKRSFLMLVKTYPIPSTKYGETVCCAGIDAETRKWVRVYPVNFRSLPGFRKFRKWQFIEAVWGPPTGDSRPESIKVQQDTIVAGETIGAGKPGWRRRRDWLDPVVDESLEALGRTRRTLGVIRPRSIDGFVIRRADAWDKGSRDELEQLTLTMDTGGDRRDLEIIPWDFLYRFHCRDDDCGGHEMEIFDWEVAQAYRNFRRLYGETGWQQKLRQKFLDELPSRDLHLILGTHHRFGNWMIVGVLHPAHVQVLEAEAAPRRHDVGQREAMTLPLLGLEAEEGDRPRPPEGDDGIEDRG